MRKREGGREILPLNSFEFYTVLHVLFIFKEKASKKQTAANDAEAREQTELKLNELSRERVIISF